MPAYQHVLIGLDLSSDSQQIIDRVKSLFAGNDQKISLIHVQEPLSFAYSGDIPMDLTKLQSQIGEQAKANLSAMGQQLNVPEQNQHVLIGQPAHEMRSYASENNVDLIVVGSHGRHGLSLLFGSTSTGVIRGSDCDVLAIRV